MSTKCLDEIASATEIRQTCTSRKYRRSVDQNLPYMLAPKACFLQYFACAGLMLTCQTNRRTI